MGRIRWALSTFAFALHLAVAGRYDFFRDELYFIACGRRPAFGYVDQPPLVPLLAAMTQTFGERLWLLRAVAALGAFGVVWFTCRIAELAGAGRIGALVAGLAAATAPMFMGLTATLGTQTFQTLAWAAVTLFAARAVVRGEARAFLWAGLVIGVDLEAKYDLPLFILPLLATIVLTGKGRTLLRKEALFGALVAAGLALPSVVWQLQHGLPFLELVRAGAAGKNKVVPAGAFLLNQLLVMNPLYAALAVFGAAAPFAMRGLREWRFVSLAFALTLLEMLALHAKDYYFAPAYGPVFALGAAALDRLRWPAWLKLAPLAPALAYSAVAAPMALPVLDPPVLASYMRALHLSPESGENLDQSDIPQTFADMLGWRALARGVAEAVRSLPPDEQKRVVIFGRNYGESAAIDFYGPAFGLRGAIGRHNQYWLWGPGDADGSLLLLINWSPKTVAGRCREAVQIGEVSAPHIMPFENHAPLTLCRGLLRPVKDVWPELKLIL